MGTENESSPKPPRLKWRTVFLALLCVTVFVRVTCLTRTACVAKDATVHIAIAREWHDGDYEKAIGRRHHVFHPIIVASVYRITGDWISAGQAVSLIASILTLLPVVILVRTSAGDVPAVCAGLLYAFHPYASRFGADVLTDPLYALFFLSAVASGAIALVRMQMPYFALSGMFGGLAYLVRPEGVSILMVVAAWCVLIGIAASLDVRKNDRTAPSAVGLIARVVLLVAGFSIIAWPYVLALRKVHGKWMLTPKKDATSLMTGQSAEERNNRSQEERQAPSETSRTKPSEPLTASAIPLTATSAEWLGRPAVDAALSVPYVFSKALPHVYLPLFLVGMAAWLAASGRSLRAAGEDRKNRLCRFISDISGRQWSGDGTIRSNTSWARPAVGVCLLTYLGLMSLVLFRVRYHCGYLSTRHLYPLCLIGLAWAGAGAVAAGRRLANRFRRLPAANLLSRALTESVNAAPDASRTLCGAVIVAVVFCLVVMPKTLKAQRTRDLAEVRSGRRIAAEWRDAGGRRPPRVITARNPRIALYAGAESLDLVKACRVHLKAGKTIEELPPLLSSIMVESGADYLAYVEEELDRFLPGLKSAITAAPPSGLMRAFVEISGEEGKKRTVVVYRLSD